MQKRGFTLIELLVVIAIIGLLSSIVYASLGGTREKAKITRAQSDLNQIVKAIAIAQGESGKTLISMTDNAANCMQCTEKCNEGADINSNNCKAAFTKTLAKIQEAANGIVQGLTQITSDPWGHPYMFDANQGEGGTANCANRDTIRVYGHESAVPLPIMPLSDVCP